MSHPNLLEHVFLVGNVLEDVAWRFEAIGVSVGDLEAELFLDGHHDLDVIERVESEVFREVRVHRQLLCVDFVVQREHKCDSLFQSLLCQGSLQKF